MLPILFWGWMDTIRLPSQPKQLQFQVASRPPLARLSPASQPVSLTPRHALPSGRVLLGFTQPSRGQGSSNMLYYEPVWPLEPRGVTDRRPHRDGEYPVYMQAWPFVGWPLCVQFIGGPVGIKPLTLAVCMPCSASGARQDQIDRYIYTSIYTGIDIYIYIAISKYF